ncbi:MAG: nicotinate-nucleotide adenylyltransferase [Chloroflexota bacterium]|nr:nicotinate-nucleotide adenylyltransferase [Chloroflexota bacterium]
MTARIGILGGTFDPIHNGHLAIAEEARLASRLDRVLFVPASQQPLKRSTHIATPEQRLAMTQLACASNIAFEVSRIELDRPGPSFTLTTLEALQSAQIGELHFILGEDALADLTRWHGAAGVVELARIIAVGRPGCTLDLTRIFQALPALRERLTVLPGPTLDISSTALRLRVAASRPIRYQTPDAVVDYINEHSLYRSAKIGTEL